MDLDHLELAGVERFDTLEFGTALRLISAVEEVLEGWDARAIDLDSETTEDEIGARIRLTTRFYTRNVPRPEVPTVLTGEYETDPHLWTRIGDRRALIPLDPRWYTSKSSYTWFKAGNARFTVLGNLVDIDDDRFVISPLIVALPKPEW